jgi:DNA-binding MarR family transcriptional regulator
MRQSPTLPQLQQRILEQLAEAQYATGAQLARFCNVQAPAISKAIQKLLSTNLVDGSLLTRPMILHLTPAGRRLLGVPQPTGRRHPSWSVMTHACHLNAVQELMLKNYAGFRFLSRAELLKQGLNPAFGEHGGIDDAGTAWFVLLDDYMMTADVRIPHSWTRRHTPNKKYWLDPTGRAWRDVAQYFMVFCTDGHHAARHREWILKNRLPAEVVQIKPLWKS